jgi:hypothetical protein
MGNLIDKFVAMFKKPDTSDQERIERWKTEVDEADRLKTLHRKSRKQDQQTKKAKDNARQEGASRAKGLTIEDFEKAEQAKKQKQKQKNKTLSSNF